MRTSAAQALGVFTQIGALWVKHCLSESLWPKAHSVRNRQRRSWGGSDHTRYKDEAPILKKNRGFIP